LSTWVALFYVYCEFFWLPDINGSPSNKCDRSIFTGFRKSIKVCRNKNTIHTDFNVLQKQRLIKHTNSMSCTLGRLVLSNEIDPEAKGMSSDKTQKCRFCGSNTVPPEYFLCGDKKGQKLTSVWRSPRWAKAACWWSFSTSYNIVHSITQTDDRLPPKSFSQSILLGSIM
jgi:hypothetical protein